MPATFPTEPNTIKGSDAVNATTRVSVAAIANNDSSGGVAAWSRSLALLLAVACTSVPSASALAEDPDLAEKVGRLVAPYVERQVVMGMTVAILAGDQQHVAGYGRLSQDDD